MEEKKIFEKPTMQVVELKTKGILLESCTIYDGGCTCDDEYEVPPMF